MEAPQGFPYSPALAAFAIGILIGIGRGAQARIKALMPTARAKLAAIRQRVPGRPPGKNHP
jgi:hypothetical protein